MLRFSRFKQRGHEMTTRSHVLEQLEAAKHQFASALGIRKLALFGSFARDEQTGDSDVDILVDMSKPTFDHYMDLKFFLEDRLGTKVDLVLDDTLKPLLRRHVERELIYV